MACTQVVKKLLDAWTDSKIDKEQEIPTKSMMYIYIIVLCFYMFLQNCGTPLLPLSRRCVVVHHCTFKV